MKIARIREEQPITPRAEEQHVIRVASIRDAVPDSCRHCSLVESDNWTVLMNSAVEVTREDRESISSEDGLSRLFRKIQRDNDGIR